MAVTTDITKNYTLQRILVNEYRTHQMVWKFFANDAVKDRDFLYRVELYNGLPTVYTVSRREPANVNDVWSGMTKAYEPTVARGQRLGFVLRANPTKKVYDDEGNHFRRDVVLGAKIEMERNGIPRERWPSNYEIVHDAGVAWLESKGDMHGFSIEPNEISIDSYLQRSFRAKKGKPNIVINTVDYSGTLVVDEPERFVDALYSGIGPAKGFGCGLLMVRPARG
jgi:CRISPR system Cascade subunit CasE